MKVALNSFENRVPFSPIGALEKSTPNFVLKNLMASSVTRRISLSLNFITFRKKFVAVLKKNGSDSGST